MPRANEKSSAPSGRSSELPAYPEIEVRYHRGNIVSNDAGYKFVAPKLLERISAINGGTGLFIGSGGMLSILPDLGVNRALVIDKDPHVLEVNRLLANIVRDAPAFSQVVDFLNFQGHEPAYPAFRSLVEAGRQEDAERIVEDIAREARAYGEHHWTSRTHFPRVQAALRAKPQAWVKADIKSPELAQYLQVFAQDSGELITFANLTNVHDWLDDTRSMDFLRDWPIADDPTILYSIFRHRINRSWPSMAFTTSVDEYIEETNKDLMT